MHCCTADLAAYTVGFAPGLLVDDYMLEFPNFENFDFAHSHMDSAGNATRSGEYIGHYLSLGLVSSSCGSGLGPSYKSLVL